MDQNGSLLEIETSKSKKFNRYYLFIERTLQFLVPVLLLSFLLTYASGFSFIFTYNFHCSTLVFPLFSHALERKYMFLICIGILAFLAKTLSFNSSSSPSVTDFIHDESMKSTADNVKPTSESSVMEEAVLPLEETRLSVQYSTATSEDVALEGEEEEEVYATKSKSSYAEAKPEAKAPIEINKGRLQTGSSWIIESEDTYCEDEQEDDEAEESASLLRASASEEGNEVNLNTEELNQKFEEFIRKMKEEIRIEAKQQLIVA